MAARSEFRKGIGVPPAKGSRKVEKLKRELGYSSSTAWRIAFKMNKN